MKKRYKLIITLWALTLMALTSALCRAQTATQTFTGSVKQVNTWRGGESFDSFMRAPWSYATFNTFDSCGRIWFDKAGSKAIYFNDCNSRAQVLSMKDTATLRSILLSGGTGIYTSGYGLSLAAGTFRVDTSVIVTQADTLATIATKTDAGKKVNYTDSGTIYETAYSGNQTYSMLTKDNSDVCNNYCFAGLQPSYKNIPGSTTTGSYAKSQQLFTINGDSVARIVMTTSGYPYIEGNVYNCTFYLQYSVNGGKSWQDTTRIFHSDTLQAANTVVGFHNNILTIIALGVSPNATRSWIELYSADHGATFTQTSENYHDMIDTTGVPYGSIVALDSGQYAYAVYGTASTGYNKWVQIRRSTDMIHFSVAGTMINSNASSIAWTEAALVPVGHDSIIAYVRHASTVNFPYEQMQSTDNGWTWTDVGSTNMSATVASSPSQSKLGVSPFARYHASHSTVIVLSTERTGNAVYAKQGYNFYINNLSDIWNHPTNYTLRKHWNRPMPGNSQVDGYGQFTFTDDSDIIGQVNDWSYAGGGTVGQETFGIYTFEIQYRSTKFWHPKIIDGSRLVSNIYTGGYDFDSYFPFLVGDTATGNCYQTIQTSNGWRMDLNGGASTTDKPGDIPVRDTTGNSKGMHGGSIGSILTVAGTAQAAAASSPSGVYYGWTSPGVAGSYLRSAGTSSVPTYSTIPFSDITGTLNISAGGTGQTSANAAINALLPSQSGKTGYVLSTDGTNTSWNSVSGTGTVTSVGLSYANSGTDVTISGSPITGAGTLTINIPDVTSSTTRGLINNSTQAINGLKELTGGMCTSTTAVNSNLYGVGGAAASSFTVSGVLINGSSATAVRGVVAGSSAYTVPNNTAYSPFIVANTSVTGPSSGNTSQFIGSAFFKAPTFTASSGTVGILSTVGIDSAVAGGDAFTIIKGGAKFGGDVKLPNVNSYTSGVYSYARVNASNNNRLETVNIIPYSDVANKAHAIFTPSSGGTLTLVNNQYNIINPSGSLSSLTVSLPAAPANNDFVVLKFTQSITSVTYSGGTVLGAPASPAAGQYVVLSYDASSSTWY